MLAASDIFSFDLYRKEFNRTVFILIIASLVATVLSELSLPYIRTYMGYLTNWGHFLKLISFFLIYKAIIENRVFPTFGFALF